MLPGDVTMGFSLTSYLMDSSYIESAWPSEHAIDLYQQHTLVSSH